MGLQTLPIPSDRFKREGKPPQRREVQKTILKWLEANPDQAFSSKELEDIVETRRESINQALRTLEDKELILRGMIEENRRLVTYANITEKGKQEVQKWGRYE